MPIRIIRQATAISRAASAVVAAAAILAPGCSLLIDVPPKKTAPASPSADGGSDAPSSVPPRGPDGAPDAPAPERDAAPEAAADAKVADSAPPPDAPPVDAACTGAIVPWYPDSDRDGFGRADSADAVRLSCARPGAEWATVAGDCADDDALVHPGQVTYFGTPYRRADGSESFDYDCSNTEDGDLTIPISPKNCGLLSLALCGGMGYAATGREAFGLNPYCGSGVWSTCEAKGLGILVCEATTVVRNPRYGCR